MGTASFARAGAGVAQTSPDRLIAASWTSRCLKRSATTGSDYKETGLTRPRWPSSSFRSVATYPKGSPVTTRCGASRSSSIFSAQPPTGASVISLTSNKSFGSLPISGLPQSVSTLYMPCSSMHRSMRVRIRRRADSSSIFSASMSLPFRNMTMTLSARSSLRRSFQRELAACRNAASGPVRGGRAVETARPEQLYSTCSGARPIGARVNAFRRFPPRAGRLARASLPASRRCASILPSRRRRWRTGGIGRNSIRTPARRPLLVSLEEHRNRIDFLAWTQWIADQQLAPRQRRPHGRAA